MDTICCTDSFWSQKREFSRVNVWVENLPVWHLPLPLDSLYFCALPDFVCPGSIRLRLCFCELYCLFFFHDLTPYSDKEAETQWEPLHFLPYFLLLNVTSKQINSLRILISQEITYLMYITILLFLVCTHRAYMLSSLFIFPFLGLSDQNTCIPKHNSLTSS